MSDRIQQIEAYVRQTMSAVDTPDLRIAHDFKHVDRVRRWALRIARGEGIAALEPVEAAALLHDIGLTRLSTDQRSRHARVGAEMAAQFLRERRLFSSLEIEAISNAIAYHSAPGGGGSFAELLRDADKLDALGAVGLMRACTSRYARPEYDPDNVKGDTWQMTMQQFERRFTQGRGIGAYILDQVNFQISFYGELHTETARQLAQPLVEFMRAFVVQLEAEINASRDI
ncbi:MAG: HD domain-containing protein [Chloroflexi bacterium]|nr:HD domain-containing protein [Chloroflexota bacterium]